MRVRAHGMRRAPARSAVQQPWHTLARSVIALAFLATLADGRHGGDVPAATSADGGERVDVSRKIAMWRSRSGGDAAPADSNNAVRLSTYRPRPHEAPLPAAEASARLRRWRAGVGARDEVGDAAPVQTAASDRVGAWRKGRALAGQTAPETVAGGVGAAEGPSASSRAAPPEHSSARWAAAGDGADWGRGAQAGKVQMRILVCLPTMRRRNGVNFVGQVLAAVREDELIGSVDGSSNSSSVSESVLLDPEQTARMRAEARAGAQPASPAAARVRTRGTGGSGEARAHGGAAGGSGSERVQARVLVMHDEEDTRPPGADYYMTRWKHEIEAPCGFMRWRRALVLDFLHMMQAALEIMDPGLALAPPPGADTGASAAEREQEAEMADYFLWLEDDALLHQGW